MSLLYNKPPQNVSGLKQHCDIAHDAVSHEFKGTVGGLSPLHMLSAGFTHVSGSSVLHVASFHMDGLDFFSQAI